MPFRMQPFTSAASGRRSRFLWPGSGLLHSGLAAIVPGAAAFFPCLHGGRLVQESRHPDSGFYLYDFDRLAETLERLEKKEQKTLLIGVYVRVA
jgi:hypothetical protein